MAGRESTTSVSAIIPAYNAEAYLPDALDSVLAQTHPVTECMVVDDGSVDGTAAVAAEYAPQVRVVQQENSGVAAARNRGASEAASDLLSFLDADDRWHADRLERQLAALDGTPRAEAVLCATRVIDAEGGQLGVITQPPGLAPVDVLMCRASLVSVSSNLLIRRDAYEALGGFDERLSTSADWALNFRLISRGTLVVIPEPLVDYRLHAGGMSANLDRFERDMLAAYEIVFSEHPPPGADRLRRRAYANLRRMIAGSYFAERRLGRFAAHAARSVLDHPSTLPYFLGLPARRLRRRFGAVGDPLGRR